MIDYSETIPNNVNLSDNRNLARALERWQPAFRQWWAEMGPDKAAAYDIYLRTATSADPKDWAHFDMVRMPDYRWGIFLAPAEPERKIGFGAHKGEPVWQEVPGEYRSNLRRIIVTQGDTEPASIEQQRHLGHTCPSLYDLRNLFQVNVEEGRHLWAMAYLLHAYFGRDGREEAEALLERRSGDADKPRILTAFNERTPDWLSFFMFTFTTDRDGKFQLSALTESAFDPLSRTVRFMLSEESHHMFVGWSGLARVLERTAAAMSEHKTEDPSKLRSLGLIDLPTFQKYLNFHYSITADLYGAEVSSNAASFYTTGLKGRFEEKNIDDDHSLQHESYTCLEVRDGKLADKELPAIMALNERLRDDWARDVAAGVARFNRLLEKAGCGFTLRLPHKAFNRRIGAFADVHVSPDGRLLSESEWQQAKRDWLPTMEDRQFVESLMGAVTEPGRYANWIAPPPRGIDNRPLDFEYVRFN